MSAISVLQYVETLANLSEGSVHRHFNPYTDIDWEGPEFAVTPERPTLGAVGDCSIRTAFVVPGATTGQANCGRDVASGQHHEGLFCTWRMFWRHGLLQYTFWVPNGSPEYRYCLHESVEECNHTMMFQEMVNRIGVDVPGLPRSLRCVVTVGPAVGRAYCRLVFFFGVLAGEVPVDHMQKNVLRERAIVHCIRSWRR